jgi:hypothetical protein
VVRFAWGIVVERAAGPESGPCATFLVPRASRPCRGVAGTAMARPLRLQVAQEAFERFVILLVAFPRVEVAHVSCVDVAQGPPSGLAAFPPGHAAFPERRREDVPRASCPCEGTAETAVVRFAWGIVVERAAGPESGPCATFLVPRASRPCRGMAGTAMARSLRLQVAQEALE